MKKVVCFIMISLFGMGTMSAQDIYAHVPESPKTPEVLTVEIDSPIFIMEPDSIVINFDDEKSCSKSCERGTLETNWFGLDLGFSQYLDNGNLNMSTENQNYELSTWKSQHIGLHVVHQNLRLVEDHLFLDYGLKFDFNRFNFENDINLTNTDGVLSTPESGVSFDKNKLCATYLSLPIMLQFEHEGKVDFRVGAGGFAGVLVGSKLKQKSDDNGKVKTKGNYELNKYQYGLVGTFGLGPITIYGQYHLTDLFNEGAGPQLNTLDVGIILIPNI